MSDALGRCTAQDFVFIHPSTYIKYPFCIESHLKSKLLFNREFAVREKVDKAFGTPLYILMELMVSRCSYHTGLLLHEARFFLIRNFGIQNNILTSAQAVVIFKAHMYCA